jgi:CubicO group peptidase (beta-lactamase class C family)
MLDEKRLDAVLQEIIKCWEIPGLSVGIVQENEIVYAKGFGVQSLETQAPVTPASIFCVASVSKCFVACAVLQLVEQGRLSLDTPLVHYLPYFKLDDARSQQITLRQMLSHTSGMPDLDESEYDQLVALSETDPAAPERFVRSLSNRKLAAAPGERFLYSNIAYNVLGDLIAKISGQSFEDYMEEHILQPAGMPQATFFFPKVPREKLAVPHLRAPQMIVNPIYPYHRADAPASFLHANLLEMCHWSITCLKHGVFTPSSPRLLSPESYELMWTPVARWGYPPLYEDCGLGWTLGHYNELKTVSHGGMGFGWTDFLALVPERNSAVVILCNEESSARSRVIRAALNAILGLEPIVNTISWMVPISQALQTGGIQAAYACYQAIKDKQEDYFFDEDELLNLAYQMLGGQNINQALEVLQLNTKVHPKHLDSYIFMARLYLQKGETAQANASLQKAQEIDASNLVVMDLLEKAK